MADNTSKQTKGSSTTAGGTATEGTGITSTNDAVGITSISGNAPVAAPTDAAPNEAQSGTPAFAAPGEQTLGAADTGGEQAKAATAPQTKEGGGFAAKIVKPNHTHEGQPVKKGATIMVDTATYRWLLESKIAEPGNKEDVGLDVTKQGEAIKPETDEDAVKRLEAEFATKKAE